MPEGFQWVLQVFHFETSSESTHHHHHHHHYGIEKLIGWIYQHRHNGCHIRSFDGNLPELLISCILFSKFIPNSIPILMPCQKLWQSIVKLESVPQAILSQRPAPPPADLLLLMLYCVLNAFLVLVLFLGVKYGFERIAPWKRCDIVKLCLSPDINIPFLCIFPIGVGTCPPGFLETEKWKHFFKVSLGGLLVKMRRWWEMAEEIDRSGGNCFLSFSL